jgi:hypothetical protein
MLAYLFPSYKFFIMLKKIIPLTFIFLSGCSLLPESKTTEHPTNACKIIKENPDWLNASFSSYKKWGIPVSVQLAFIKKESSFRYNARPIKSKGFLFNSYQSSAYGYSQALNGTWSDYTKSTGNTYADRSSYSDSVDFIGWYLNNVSKKTSIKKNDAYNLYLAYHEGIGGYKKKSYKNKKWLRNVASSLNRLAKKYSSQIKHCNVS